MCTETVTSIFVAEEYLNVNVLYVEGARVFKDKTLSAHPSGS